MFASISSVFAVYVKETTGQVSFAISTTFHALYDSVNTP